MLIDEPQYRKKSDTKCWLRLCSWAHSLASKFDSSTTTQMKRMDIGK